MLLPAQDTTVRNSRPNQNFGHDTSLDINRTLVQFDSAALTAAVGAQDVLVSAQFELTLTNNGLRRKTAMRQVDAFRVTTPWSELGATWNCADDANTANHRPNCPSKWSMGAQPPNPWAAPATSSIAIAAAQTGSAVFDVTNDVRDFLSGAAPNYGWMLKGSTPGEFAEFASRETSTPPRLILSVRRCSAALCDDGDACTIDGCDASASCVHTPAADGASCGGGKTCDASGACVSHVVINEIESNGGDPGDWVELYNAGASAADVSGWQLLDNDDAHTPYAIPAGSVIPAGGYLVLEVAQFVFGLGGDDAARLFDTSGAIADSYAWTTHAATTYGRCPDATFAFTTTGSSTKGAANDCSGGGMGGMGGAGGTGGTGGTGGGVSPVVINEVESNAGDPGDWVELYNTGASAVDVSGWQFLDNNDTHVAYAIPAGTSIAAGGYLVLDEAQFGFGLGSGDSARLFDASGATIVDTYSWSAHATTTYGRCPNGSGEFGTTTSPTKGAANDCSAVVKVNEIESDQGTPGDWVELYNAGAGAADVSGWTLLDNDDTHTPYAIPAGTLVPAGGYLVLEVAQFGFGLGGADSARLFDASGALVDTYAWSSHAVTTYGRCPNGTGDFTTTASSTKGAENDCAPTGPVLPAWPGGNTVTTIDDANVFGTNLSGLAYEPATASAPAVLWAVRNGPSTLFRLVWNGSTFAPENANDWDAGKTLLYTDGTGEPDSEGVTRSEYDSPFVYVATERNNLANTVSRLSVLRFDTSAAGTSLVATNEWNLTGDLPVVGANLGLEGIA